MSTSYTPGAKTRSKEIIARSPTSEGAPGSVNLPTRSDETTQPTANLGTTTTRNPQTLGGKLPAVYTDAQDHANGRASGRLCEEQLTLLNNVLRRKPWLYARLSECTATGVADMQELCFCHRAWAAQLNQGGASQTVYHVLERTRRAER